MASALVRRQDSGVPYYVFPPFRDRLIHGVFTRHGGVSQGPFTSLNVSRSMGDSGQAVEENLTRLLGTLGLEKARTVQLRQVHGSRLERVGADEGGRVLGEADGLLTDAPGLALLLRFADCVPLIALDASRGAVGMAHAGWRGTVSGMARALVEAMNREFSSSPDDLEVAIGPAVGPCHYPVGPEVEREALRVFPDLAAGWFQTGRHFDLWRANEEQLAASGVERVYAARTCTACHSDEFFSVRGLGLPTGHFATVVALA